jgi:hypothetical protein
LTQIKKKETILFLWLKETLIFILFVYNKKVSPDDRYYLENEWRDWIAEKISLFKILAGEHGYFLDKYKVIHHAVPVIIINSEIWYKNCGVY